MTLKGVVKLMIDAGVTFLRQPGVRFEDSGKLLRKPDSRLISTNVTRDSSCYMIKATGGTLCYSKTLMLSLKVGKRL